MSNVTEFVASEVCTAAVHMPMETGESYQGSLLVGYYPGGKEVFVSLEGHVINMPDGYLEQVVKQLRRAYKIACANEPGDAE